MRLLVLPPSMPPSPLGFSLRLLVITLLLSLWPAFKLPAALGTESQVLRVAIDAAARIAVVAVVPVDSHSLLGFRNACYLSFVGTVTFVAPCVALRFAFFDVVLRQVTYVLILTALLIIDAALNFYCCFTRALARMCRSSLGLIDCHRSCSQEGLLTTLLFRSSVRSRLPICFLLCL